MKLPSTFLTIFTKARLFYLKFPRLEINRSIAERTLVEITIGRLVPFQFHRGTSIDRSIRRLHQHLRSIRIGEGLQTTRMQGARDGSADEESRRWILLSSTRKTCVTNFFFIRHTPLPSLFRPLYAPFSFAFHDATSTFLLIHLLRDPLPFSSSEESVRSFVPSFSAGRRGEFFFFYEVHYELRLFRVSSILERG